jgi:predicted unusual protein kinase regulating ubiquinone biosynthesis (AarF/ABC1/UbiB family)
MQSALGLRRLSRVAVFGVHALWDYKWLEWNAQWSDLSDDSEEYAALKRRVDVAVTERFLALSIANGVGFLKMAQYMSTQPLPADLVAVLARAQDQGRPRPFSEISEVFLEDTGRRPEDVFASIEQLPCAAASLAQVHRAVTKDGTPVAVKIQYPFLHELIMQDLAALHVMLAVIEWRWPELGFSWMLP